MYTLVALVGALLLVPTASFEQEVSSSGSARTMPQSAFDSIVRLECAFTAAATGNWTGRAPDARTVALSSPQLVTFSNINVVEGTASSVVAGQATSVSVRSDRSNLYILDLGSGGTATLTTVFSQESRAGRLKAVQTRTGRVAEQRYGDCAAGT